MALTVPMDDASALTRLGMRDPLYGPRTLSVERRADGAILLSNPRPYDDPFDTVMGPISHWAKADPERPWLAERVGDGWFILSYGEGRERIRSLAGGLHALGLSRAAPMLILARNNIDHAMIAYAAMCRAIPVAAVSPQYGLKGADLSRLDHAVQVIRPSCVYAEDAALFADGLSLPALAGLPVIVGANPRPGDILLADLATSSPAPLIARGHDPAKLLLTSGSTGKPKAVICLHSGVASVAAQIGACFTDPEPPVVVNQAPWSHSLGANSILQNVTHRGGTIYIDAGQPAPGRMGETVRNLKEIAPTYHNMVPAGWDLLAHELETDEALARTFFSRVRLLQYGGAMLAQSTCDRIEAVAKRVCGETISFASGYGSTETGPTCANVHWPNLTMGLLGLPIPGTVVKLAPNGDKLEFLVKGLQISPGYWNNPEATAGAFDEEGFYRTGDAAKLVDETDYYLGLAFDGRLSENFKLTSGTFVDAGAVRIGAVSALGGVISDALVCGEGEASLGLLLFLNADVARRHTNLRDVIAEGLLTYNKTALGAGGKVARALVLDGAPDPATGEITDKGYINQGLARGRRPDEIKRLFAADPDNEVIIL
ncbi:MAG: AMP-binding protein [Caulobacteraceae bacterium]